METYNDLIASRIKASRTAAGLTVEEAASSVGIGKSRWLNWECGIRAPKMDILPTVARAINSTAAYLAGFVDHEGEGSNAWQYIIPNGSKSSTQTVCSDLIAFNVEGLRAKGFEERDVLMVKCRDNSLHIDFNEGDAILINTQKKTVNAPGIFAILDNSNLIWLRRIRPEMTGGFTVYCDDKNNFPDQHFATLSDLNIVGSYIAHFHWAIN